MMNDINDELILAARLLLATLFLIFGWRKLRDYSGTVSQMVQLGVPMPVLAAGVATFMGSRLRSRSLSARSRVLRLYSCFYTRWEQRLLGIAIGQRQVRITSTAWTAFTKISASWEASCCCTLLVRENIRSMCCAASPQQLDTQRFVEAASNFYIGSGDQFDDDRRKTYQAK